MPKNIYLLSAVGLLLLGMGAGYIIATRKLAPMGGSQNQASPAPKAASKFKYQTASVNGKVTKINDRTITVLDDKGETNDFNLSQSFTVSRYPGNSKVASTSALLNDNDLGKDALIVLVTQDGDFKVTSVSYLPPVIMSSPAPIKK